MCLEGRFLRSDRLFDFIHSHVESSVNFKVWWLQRTWCKAWWWTSRSIFQEKMTPMTWTSQFRLVNDGNLTPLIKLWYSCNYFMSISRAQQAWCVCQLCLLYLLMLSFVCQWHQALPQSFEERLIALGHGGCFLIEVIVWHLRRTWIIKRSMHVDVGNNM